MWFNSVFELQLDFLSATGVLKIIFSTNQEGYENSDTTGEKVS